MHYTITYQERRYQDGRPIEDGRDITIEASDKGGFALIPEVGDFVQMIGSEKDFPIFSGKVESKLFRYWLVKDNEMSCHVNIVVASHVDLPDLIKE